jgi:hypothetical protein
LHQAPYFGPFLTKAVATKSLKIICAKAALLCHKKILVKLTPALQQCKHTLTKGFS